MMIEFVDDELSSLYWQMLEVVNCLFVLVTDVMIEFVDAAISRCVFFQE